MDMVLLQWALAYRTYCGPLSEFTCLLLTPWKAGASSRNPNAGGSGTRGRVTGPKGRLMTRTVFGACGTLTHPAFPRTTFRRTRILP